MSLAAAAGLPEPAMTPEALNAFLVAAFSSDVNPADYQVTAVRHGEVDLRFVPEARHLRPGDTIAGPVLFALVDVAAYVALLSHSGPHNLQAVTTSATTNFLVRPKLGPLSCTCRLLKLGRRLAVTDSVVHDQDGRAVLSASLTYAVPPAPSAGAGASQS